MRLAPEDLFSLDKETRQHIEDELPGTALSTCQPQHQFGSTIVARGIRKQHANKKAILIQKHKREVALLRAEIGKLNCQKQKG